MQPAQQQGRRMPSLSSVRVLSIWSSLVSGFLTDSIQHIHSLRASGVISSHADSAFGSEVRIFRKSSGTLCTTPAAIFPPASLCEALRAGFLVMRLFYQIKDYNTLMRYAAMLRGIGPANPNMRGEKLRSVFEGLGFSHVQTVIASGNVVFDSVSRNQASLEAKIEKELPKRLGFASTAIIRSKEELEALIKKNPFKGAQHSPHSYLIVTFLKNKNQVRGGVLFNVVDTKSAKTPDVMRALEKKFGKQITTRTWSTVGRILKKMKVAE